MVFGQFCRRTVSLHVVTPHEMSWHVMACQDIKCLGCVVTVVMTDVMTTVIIMHDKSVKCHQSVMTILS